VEKGRFLWITNVRICVENGVSADVKELSSFFETVALMTISSFSLAANSGNYLQQSKSPEDFSLDSPVKVNFTDLLVGFLPKLSH
jgi:hypothetical protein